MTDLSKCFHCAGRVSGDAILLSGPFLNQKTFQKQLDQVIFCTYQCLQMWLLDDLINSPFTKHALKEHEGWKPVLRQLHDELLKSG